MKVEGRTCYVKSKVACIYTTRCSGRYPDTWTMNGVTMFELLSLYCAATSKAHSLTGSKKCDLEVSICFNLLDPFISSRFLALIAATPRSKLEMSVVMSFIQFEQHICELCLPDGTWRAKVIESSVVRAAQTVINWTPMAIRIFIFF
jgi:hypothetical protein